MRAPDITPDEAMRLQALRNLRLVDTPLDERFERLTRLAKRVLDVDIVAVSLVEADRQFFKSIQGFNACETSREISFCGHAINEQDLFLIEDARKDERFADNPLVTGPPKIVFYAGVPLHSPDGFKVGTLCALHTSPKKFTETDKDQLRDIAALVELELQVAASSAVQAALVEHVSAEERRARIDPLTRLWNRHGLTEIVSDTLRHVAANRRCCALLMIDLNGFKAINDTHGHQAGDEALRITAKRLLATIRDTDIVGRLSGDEFVAVLTPCADEDAARTLAQRMANSLSSEPARIAGAAIPLRASIGAVLIPQGWAGTIDQALEHADRAMYECKRSDRNAVVIVDATEARAA